MQALRLLPSASDEVVHLRCKDEGRPVPIIEQENFFLLTHTKQHSVLFQNAALLDLLTCLLTPPNICALPIIFPKSMWNMCPLFFSMILSLWRSQMPRMKVATHHPAHECRKFITAYIQTESVMHEKDGAVTVHR